MNECDFFVFLIKRYLSIFVHCLTRLFCVFPIDSKKIIFEAYMGEKYACSPRYICEYIESKTSDYKLVWVYNKIPLPCEYRQIKRNSFLYFYHMLTAGMVIINSGQNRLVRLRDKQIQINTWHGGGAYKRIGKVKRGKRTVHYRKNDFYLSSCEKASQYVIRIGTGFYGEILNYGLPRNDMLIHFDSRKVRIIKEKLKIGNRKCVLYAPTFRKDTSQTNFALDYDRLLKGLEKKFGGEWLVLVRCHYHMKQKGEYSGNLNLMDMTQYPDMQDLLLISDVLITDYSSCIWDYSFLNRPAFLYATDLKEYDVERSFYVDIHEWPFPLCENNDELAKAIDSFNQVELEFSIKKHHNYMGCFETGDASKRVLHFIRERLKN